MSRAPAQAFGRRKTLLLFFLGLFGLMAVGRLALEAWMHRPAPHELPEIGARTDKAAPFLLVIIDGLREPTAWATEDPAMPWFQAFAQRGAWGTSIAGEPTLTAPCVRAILTGRRPDLLTGFRNFNARPVEGSIIGYLAARGAHTAHGGDAAAFQFCRRHYAAEDVLQFPDQGPIDQGECDAQAVPHVLERIAAGSNCVTLHLTAPDHAGHKWQARSREYWKACRVVDEQIRLVVETFLERFPDATVLIASDHGVSPMGTHGGGETDAKRAPFALVGPNVARIRTPDIDQCALAPTVCALLGLPQPPLADAPPAVELLDLPTAVEEHALDSYVEARLLVARSLHGETVDFIERRRAELTLRDFTDRVNTLLAPNSTGHASAALVIGAFWLMVLVALASTSRRVRPGPVAAVLTLCIVGFALAFGVLSAAVAGALVLLAAVVSLYAAGPRRVAGGGVTLACLGALPVLTAGGLMLQESFAGAERVGTPITRALWLAIPLGFLALVFARPRALYRVLVERVRAAPGLIPAFGGVLIGFTLTLRPFIDPLIHVMILYAAAGCIVVWLMLRSPGARARPAWERWLLAGVGLTLFVATRIAEGIAGEVWINATPTQDPVWMGVGVALTAAVVVLIMPRGIPRSDTVGFLLAVVATVFAYVMRTNRDAPLAVGMGASIAGVLALVWSLRFGSAHGRLLVRILAALALARRLSVMDAEFAVFAVAALGAALAARIEAPRTRIGLAWLAVGILALRTAIFHAMGFEESFSTLDVGQAFAGLGDNEARALDAAGGAVITWQVIVATLQMALRMAMPWVLILAALSYALQQTRGVMQGSMRCVLGDLVVSFSARGAAIATALWAWWRQSWWVTHAYTVYAYAVGEVILLLVCATLVGAWGWEADRTARAPEAAPA